MREYTNHVLVTGGAGYIGSHVAKILATRGFIPVSYDSLVSGHRWAVQWGPFWEGDIGDKARLLDVIRRYGINAVIHLAAFTHVGESIAQPDFYFDNNVTKSLRLLDVMVEAGVRHVVFSSSCATYGAPMRMPITEDTLQVPVNPYGETKLIIEKALRWYSAAYELSWTALRYFNAAGADLDGELGEVHTPKMRLIPLVLDSSLGRRTVEIYGDDYPTADGTCVRDYVHVSDLAEAHVRALEYLMNGGMSIALNLGTGKGHSVMQVICAVEKATGRKVSYRVASRRAGDPAVLIADPSLAGKVLAWRPEHSCLDTIVKSAWKWHSREVFA